MNFPCFMDLDHHEVAQACTCFEIEGKTCRNCFKLTLFFASRRRAAWKEKATTEATGGTKGDPVKPEGSEVDVVRTGFAEVLTRLDSYRDEEGVSVGARKKMPIFAHSL